jgi:4-amino-4-deoxy-L-arabinose transferase-like glycosyltransferase
LELVLIPAGKFIMGAAEPTPTEADEYGFRKGVLVGLAALAMGGAVLLVLLGAVIIQAVRKRQRPKFSLARLLAMTVAAGVAVLGVLHWKQSARGLESVRTEYAAAGSNFYNYHANTVVRPAHSVTLTHAFYLGACDVTQEQYQAVLGKNPSKFKGSSNPVE